MAYKIWVGPGVTATTVNWSYSFSAFNGGLVIYKNGSVVVNTGTTNSGNFAYNSGDYIYVEVSSVAQKFLFAGADLDISDDTGLVFVGSDAPGATFAFVAYPDPGTYYPVGNVYINASSYQY